MTPKEQSTPNESTKEPDGLTGLQRAFVAKYLENGFNATRAAIEAGYAPDGARVEGCRLLRKPKVMDVIAKAFRDRGISPEAIQILLSIVAFDTDVCDFEPFLDGSKTLDQLRAEGVDTRAVKSATVNPVTKNRRVELHNRLDAVDKLMRILGLVTDKHEHEITGSFKGLRPDIIKANERKVAESRARIMRIAGIEEN